MKYRIKVIAEVEAGSAKEANQKLGSTLIAYEQAAPWSLDDITMYYLDAIDEKGNSLVGEHVHDESCGPDEDQ